MAERYDHIVALGGWCQCSYQVRRRFGLEAAHIFDWWVTPTDSLVRLLTEDFSGLFEPGNMQVVGNTESVMCAKYGVLHHHDFKRDPIDDKIIAEAVSAQCDDNKKKYAFLLSRLRALRGRVLFIRHSNGYVQYRHQAETTAALVNEVVRLLDAKLPGLDDFDVLHLNVNLDKATLDPRVIMDAVDNHGDESWNGSDAGWDEMFERNGLRPDHLRP
jgi:hypothetical protein